jgi:hypothetical protein
MASDVLLIKTRTNRLFSDFTSHLLFPVNVFTIWVEFYHTRRKKSSGSNDIIEILLCFLLLLFVAIYVENGIIAVEVFKL